MIPTCRHHKSLVHEAAEELLKYMTKSVLGKLSHSRGWPKTDEHRSQQGECDHCGKEHSWEYQKSAEEKLRAWATLSRRDRLVFDDWGDKPMFVDGRQCQCWEIPPY